MKKITVGFSKPSSKFKIGSLAIRYYMGTEYSHVYIKFEGKERELIYESVGRSGTRFMGAKLWSAHAVTVKSFSIEVEDSQHRALINYCIDSAGLEYGFWQNIGLVIADRFKLKNNPFKSGKNCSEAVGEVLESIGYVFDKDFNLLTPKDIFLKLNNGLQNE